MATTFVLLFCAAWLMAVLLFRSALVLHWAAMLEGMPGWSDCGRLSVFLASVGLIIGALGASFENQYYFRHVTHVDEELYRSAARRTGRRGEAAPVA